MQGLLVSVRLSIFALLCGSSRVGSAIESGGGGWKSRTLTLRNFSHTSHFVWAPIEALAILLCTSIFVRDIYGIKTLIVISINWFCYLLCYVFTLRVHLFNLSGARETPLSLSMYSQASHRRGKAKGYGQRMKVLIVHTQKKLHEIGLKCTFRVCAQVGAHGSGLAFTWTPYVGVNEVYKDSTATKNAITARRSAIRNYAVV